MVLRMRVSDFPRCEWAQRLGAQEAHSSGDDFPRIILRAAASSSCLSTCEQRARGAIAISPCSPKVQRRGATVYMRANRGDDGLEHPSAP